LADDPTRIASREDTRRNILRDYASRSDGRVRTDRHARTQNYAAAEPDVLLDGNRCGQLRSLDPLSRIQRVETRVELDIGPDQYVAAEPDAGTA
jgi:hypothetical protein